MRILLCEDSTDLRERLGERLVNAGYVVDMAATGPEAEFLGATERYDAVILDLGLPELDGVSVLRHWRADRVDVPVMILTARDTWRDKVDGLRAGADDYLCKPFESEELLARIEALIRRAHGRGSPVLTLGTIEIDPARRNVRKDGMDVVLTGLEFRVLCYLAMNAGRVVSQEELIEHTYGHTTELNSNVIEVAISRVRKKLHAGVIQTRRGHGYCVCDEV